MYLYIYIYTMYTLKNHKDKRLNEYRWWLEKTGLVLGLREVRVRVRSSMAKGPKALSILTFSSPYKLKGAGETISV